ncbi:PQQ-binding-like beta-propeller repeat protein, partial [Candidatus Sumerlaeota bacterium]|nr:PQQ-binding-like beta-propeller repeat protein [Candidatus Sumerlaeota bacterium]
PFPNDATLDIHLFVAGFEKSSGKLLWEHEVKTDNVIGTHRKHNMATPSCTTDGERVYAWFGSGQLGCYDFDGKVIWERDLSQEYGPFVIIWGHGSSPVLYGDGLILLCDHARTPYILAVDKKTGKNIWKTERPKGVRSYSTPYFVKVGGKDQMIVNTAGEVQGLDPANGSIIWNAKGILVAPVPSPVASGDLLFTYGGYDSGPIMAIKLGGAGDVTDSNVLWKKQKGGPYVPSLVYDGKYLYMINDKGVGTCFEGTTGNEIWKERIGGNFSTSPVMADGKLYVTSEEGETVVLEAAPEFKVVSRNVLDEYTLGSIAVSDGKLYMRTDKTLFCIGK